MSNCYCLPGKAGGFPIIMIIGHPTRTWFEKTPFWHNNQGRHPREARGHYFAMRAIRPALRGFLLLDGDNRGLPERETAGEGLTIGRWRRYEIENYLLHPAALRRFVETAGGPLFAASGDRYLQDELPPAVLRDPLGTHDYLDNTPVSKTLLPAYLQRCDLHINKIDYFKIAERMLPEEIHGDVRDMLDAIAEAFGIAA